MLTPQGLRFRAALFHVLRSFLNQNGFLEVDTPIRQPLLIPEANITPLRSQDWFLQSSPELYMKRLLAAGCDKIYQICRCFRSGEQGRLHMEEFVMVEWYRTGDDYLVLMEDCEHLLQYIGEHIESGGMGEGNGLQEGVFSETDFLWKGPYERLRVNEAFNRYSPVSMEQSLQDGRFDEILVEHVEPNLGLKRPLFLYDYPVELGSLARRSDKDERVVERFELYVKGIELANGFSELTDSSEQRQRFKEEFLKLNTIGLNWDMPERFLRELEKIEKAAGIAFGFDRLLMLVMGKEAIGDVVPFSHDEL